MSLFEWLQLQFHKHPGVNVKHTTYSLSLLAELWHIFCCSSFLFLSVCCETNPETKQKTKSPTFESKRNILEKSFWLMNEQLRINRCFQWIIARILSSHFQHHKVSFRLQPENQPTGLKSVSNVFPLCFRLNVICYTARNDK